MECCLIAKIRLELDGEVQTLIVPVQLLENECKGSESSALDKVRHRWELQSFSIHFSWR